MYYTNFFREKNNIFLRSRDENGKRVDKVLKCKPYLFIPTTKPTKYKNLQNKPVDRIDFDSVFEANKFIEKYKEVANFSVFGFTKYEYNQISDEFPILNFNLNHIVTGYLDIEVFSEEGFPDPDQALHPITVISIKRKEKLFVFWLNEDNKKIKFDNDENIVYVECKNEIELLSKFLLFLDKADLDVITGWNIEGFDIKYLYFRIERLMGTDEAKKLSPLRKVYISRKIFNNKQVTYVNLRGISVLDYLTLYKKFTQNEKDSYTLNNICSIELNEKKVDYSEYESLNDLWIKNPKLYIEYNIHDTNLVSKLEDKLGFIELAITIAYDAKINYEDALGSVLLWEVIIMNYLKKKNIVLPMNKITGIKDRIEGAHVKEPIVGLHEWVVSFDLTSLYPHIIMGWNISPETFFKKISNNVNIDKILQGLVPTEELKRLQVSMSANNCLYDNKIKGFLPELMEQQFKLRSDYKKKMLAAEKQFEKTKDEKYELEATKYYNYQWAKKIQLNSAYGAIANNYFMFYNRDNAEAVTYTGQLIIRWAELKINEELNKMFKTSNVDYVVASDTDSLYLRLNSYVKTLNEDSKQVIVEKLDKLCQDVLTQIFNQIFTNLSNMMNCKTNSLYMKRENIIEKAVWRAKKNYAALVWDSEGVRYSEPDLKIVGLEPVRSNIPLICRNKIKEAIGILFQEGKNKVYDFINAFRVEFNNIPVYEIAKPISVKDMNSYKASYGEIPYTLGSPQNVKAALLYNKFIIDNKLLNNYPLINNGDKIKLVTLTKFNPINDDVIGAPDGNFPKELQIEKYVDREAMFDLTFKKPVQSLLEASGFDPEKINNLEGFM